MQAVAPPPVPASQCEPQLWLDVVALLLPVLGCLFCSIVLWSLEVITVLKHTLMLSLFGDRNYLLEKYFFP